MRPIPVSCLVSVWLRFVVIGLKFFRFDQHITDVAEHCNGNNEERCHGYIFSKK